MLFWQIHIQIKYSVQHYRLNKNFLRYFLVFFSAWMKSVTTLPSRSHAKPAKKKKKNWLGYMPSDWQHCQTSTLYEQWVAYIPAVNDPWSRSLILEQNEYQPTPATNINDIWPTSAFSQYDSVFKHTCLLCGVHRSYITVPKTSSSSYHSDTVWDICHQRIKMVVFTGKIFLALSVL